MRICFHARNIRACRLYFYIDNRVNLQTSNTATSVAFDVFMNGVFRDWRVWCAAVVCLVCIATATSSHGCVSMDTQMCFGNQRSITHNELRGAVCYVIQLNDSHRHGTQTGWVAEFETVWRLHFCRRYDTVF